MWPGGLGATCEREFKMADLRRGFFRMGITGDVGWPSREQDVAFKGLTLKLMPETESLAPSIVVRMDGTRSQGEVRQALQEFLSALVWARDRPAVETFSTFCTGAPLGVGKGPTARMIDNSIIEYAPAPADPRAKLALALYREARSVNMLPYEFLGYFKILNVIHNKGNAQIEWIRQTVGKVPDLDAKKRLAEIASAGSDAGDYLYVSGRCAVAHAFGDPVVNPDDPGDVGRLSQDLPVIKALARYVIEHELGVRSEATVWEEHLYEIEGFRGMFGPDMVARLKGGDEVKAEELVVPEVLSLRLQGHEQLASFSGLRASVDAVQGGVVRIALEATESKLRVWVLLYFQEERLVLDAVANVEVIDDGTVEAARMGIDYLKFLQGWLANGVAEVWHEGERLGRSEPAMPVNMRPDWGALDRQVEELKKRVERGPEGSAKAGG